MGGFYAIVGIIFLTVPADDILKFVFIILGVILIIANGLVLLDCLPKIRKDKAYIVVLIISIIQIIMGVFVIVTESKTLLIITGAILVALPTLAVIAAKDKKEQLKLEITKISLGVVFIVIGATDAARLVFVALGIISLIFGAMYLVIALLMSIIKDEIDSTENSIYKDGRLIASNYDEKDK
jgi:hypothetical protein